ncbi:MAG: hypothetical protein ACI8WB_005240 [Phenylobacterium sp.]|jgi:hypothetical protein
MKTIWLWVMLWLVLLTPLSVTASPAVEYDVLFLDAFLAKTSLDMPLEALTSDFEQFYLPLQELAAALELPLVIKPLQVSGWYIDEKNQVLIDFAAKQFQVGDKSGVIKTSQWLIEDDLLYIQADAFALWFGIHSEIKSNTLKVNFTSEQLLPRQAKLARQQKRQRLTSQKRQTKTASLVNDNYQWFTLPLFDMNSQLGWQDKAGEQSSNTTYAITGSGDLAQHASEFSFNKTPSNQQLRLKLHKKIQFQARDWYYEFGDISAGGNEISGGGGSGRGFSWRNSRDSDQRFSSHRFEGNAQPGWEAELYRGDALIDVSLRQHSVTLAVGQSHY